MPFPISCCTSGGVIRCRPGERCRWSAPLLHSMLGRSPVFHCHSATVRVVGNSANAVGDHVDYESIIKLADGFNGADLRNICTEAGAHANQPSPLFSPLPMQEHDYNRKADG